MKLAFAVVFGVLAGVAGTALLLRKPPEPERDLAVVVQRVHDVARLETLDVALYKKIDFAPDPTPRDSVLGSVAQWTRYAVRPPKGKAIVFADAHLALDLRRSTVRVQGKRVQVALPPVETRVELRPAETEIIGSNLDSAETAQLFDRAKAAFLASVQADETLRERARESARRSLRALLFQLGATDVVFVDSPTPPGA